VSHRYWLASCAVKSFAAGSAACAAAPSLGVLIAARVLQGLGASALLPCSLALLVHQFPDPRARARALGVWGGMGSLGVALGPVFGGALVAAAGWRSIFLVNVPICALTVFLLRRHVAESPLNPERRPDLPGLLLPGDLVVVNNSRTLPAAVPAGPDLRIHFSTARPDGGWLVEPRIPAGKSSLPHGDEPPPRVIALPGGADPDKFLKEQGADAYSKLLAQAPPYLDYLIGRAQRMDRSTAAGKVAALNFLMPFVQRLPNRLLRSEWATRIASELRVDEPVLREALRRAAAERRSEVKPKAELLGPPVKSDERQLMQMLVESEGFREKLAREITSGGLHRGLETEKIFEALISHAGGRPDPATLAAQLEEKDRRLLFEVLFEPSVEGTWEEAESCLDSLRNRRIAEELAGLEKKIQALPPGEDQNQLHRRKLELNRLLSSKQGPNKFSAGV